MGFALAVRERVCGSGVSLTVERCTSLPETSRLTNLEGNPRSQRYMPTGGVGGGRRWWLVG